MVSGVEPFFVDFGKKIKREMLNHLDEDIVKILPLPITLEPTV